MTEHMTCSRLGSGLMLSLLIALAGCSRGVIEGTVVDTQGDELPGVAVSIAGTEFEDLTDARGQYRIRYRVGDLDLRFAKSGYTPGQLSLTVDELREVTAKTVQLWRLPVNPGVYQFQGNAFHDLTRVEPREFFMAEGDRTYGTRRDPDLVLDDPMPLLVCYKTPRYDARLSRLEKVQAHLNLRDDLLYDVWRVAGTVPAGLTPIDQAESLLLELKLDAPLDPGVYALGWGALEGYTTIDKRVFMFSVAGPPEDELTSEGDAEGVVEDGEAEEAVDTPPSGEEAEPTE